MDFTIQLKKTDLVRAEVLQARLHLQDITLYESEAAGGGPPAQPVEPVRLEADLHCELDHQNEAGLSFAVTLLVSCHDQLTFHIRATILARYRFVDRAKPASAAEIEAFRKSHAALAAWPYIREFVQSTAARMGFPTEPLPLLRVVLRNA